MQKCFVGSQLAYCEEKVGGQVVNQIHFQYDASGTPVSMQHGSTYYYYVTNLQGDVLHLTNASGTVVVSYTYDPYGKPLTTTGTLASTVGAANPLRYRGYYYDTETGFYYLQSRYYDPTICRFINADSYASTGQGIIGNNMFAYCRNNPVVRVDIPGTADKDCFDTDPLDNEDLERLRDGMGGSGGAGDSPTNISSGPIYGSGNGFGYGQAPKQGSSGSTYTQLSSDGKNSIVSKTTYNEYGMRGQRIDFSGRDHDVGLPHVHMYSYTVRDGNVFQNDHHVYPYRMD